MPSNVSVIMDDKFDFPDSWIEIYNSGDEEIDLCGYSFSDENSIIRKWTLKQSYIINPGEYKLIYFDKEDIGIHANFRLDINGATLFMYNEEDVLIDKFKYGKDIFNTSFARVPDGSENIVKLIESTPCNTNDNSIFSDLRTSTPEIDITGNFFDNEITINVTSATDNALILYTSDGSEPSIHSDTLSFDGNLTISATGTYKFKAISDSLLQSSVITRTFFLNYRPTHLPIISLSLNPEYLFDDTIGIYIEGKNGIPGNCITEPQNYNQPWRRPVNIEMFEFSGAEKSVINQVSEMRISGGCSRDNVQKSLILYANKRFGTKRFKYDLFDEKPDMEIKSFMLRNCGNDFNIARIRDPYIQTMIAGKANIDYQAYQPAIIFINGQYFGIQNIRERSNEDFVLSNHGYEEEEIDLISLEVSEPVVVCGDINDYEKMIDYASNHSLNFDEYYEEVAKQIDIEEYINYMFIQIFSANRDWPANNCKLWKPKTESGKWRWILMDTDFGLGLNNISHTHNTLTYAMGTHTFDFSQNLPFSTLLFRKLMRNKRFRNQFIDRAFTAMGDFLHPDILENTLDSLITNIIDEAPYHTERWNLRSHNSWISSLDFISNWVANRAPEVVKFISDEYNLNPTIPLKITSNLPNGNRDKIKLNDYLLKERSFDGVCILGNEIRLDALESDDFDFAGWRIKEIYENEVKTYSIYNEPSYTLSLDETISALEISSIYFQKGVLHPDKDDNIFDSGLVETDKEEEPQTPDEKPQNPDEELKKPENNENEYEGGIIDSEIMSDKIVIYYTNSHPTSLSVFLYTIDGTLVDSRYIEDKDIQFSYDLNFRGIKSNIYIIKCISDFGVTVKKIKN